MGILNTGYNYFDTVVDNGGGSTAWVKQSGASTLQYGVQVIGDTDVYIYQFGNMTPSGNGLKLTNINSINIPNGAAIKGVDVRLHVSSNYGACNQRTKDTLVQLIVGGSQQGTNKGNAVCLDSQTFASQYYGGSADLWGTILTPNIVNASDFGLMLQFDRSDASSANQSVNLDYVGIDIYYELSGMFLTL